MWVKQKPWKRVELGGKAHNHGEPCNIIVQPFPAMHPLITVLQFSLFKTPLPLQGMQSLVPKPGLALL